MKKGIVMEIDEAFLTLLTPDGEFLRTKKLEQPYSIGEEIYFFPLEQTADAKALKVNRFFKAKPIWLSAAALLVFLSTFIPFYQNNKAYAYMSIDVNPSIELGLNKKMQVVELTGFNKEGKQVISHLKDWKKVDVSSLTEKILTEIKKEGYLKKNNHIIISTVRMEHPETEVEKRLQDNIKEIKTAVNDEEVNLTYVSGTEKELEKAHKLGITAGKLQVKDSEKTKDKENSNINKRNENTNIKKKNSVPSSTNQTDSPGEKNKKQSGQIKVPGTTNQSEKTINKVPADQMKKEKPLAPQDKTNGLAKSNKVYHQDEKDKLALPPSQSKKMDEEKVKHHPGKKIEPSKQPSKHEHIFK
ncbi:anti-sigma factor domain-containing protein [Neobacillus sp. LXY-1]|uniref:anti-sigma factor domain-containing protein n=1 Tax=Neobacillus sp. LXY-1 TaxID=3379133 RepID=UPI003EE346C2